MFPENVRVTSELFWRAALPVALLDLVFVFVLSRLIKPDTFRRMQWSLTITAGVFFTLLWAIVLAWAWEWYYRYVFADWMRYSAPIFGVGYLLATPLMWRLSRRAPVHPVTAFAILGGVEGILTHAWAIFGAGLLQKAPLTLGADPLAVLAFACFEKMSYWCAILFIAWLAQRILRT